MPLILLDAQGVVVGVDAPADGGPDAAPALAGVGLGTHLPQLLAARASAGDGDAKQLHAALTAALAGRPAAFDRQGAHGHWQLRPVQLRPGAAHQPGGPAAVAGPGLHALRLDAAAPARGELDRLQELLVSRTVQLAAAREQAEAAGRARADFLAHTSHRMRTPLNAIVSLAHLLQRDTDDPTARARVEAVRQAAQELSTMIDAGLELAHADGRHPGPRFQPPAVPTAPTAPKAPLPAADVAALLRRRHSGRRVLVAEDDDISQLAMVELLTDVGLQVDTADDGLSAVDMVSRRTYAMILLDLRMPRLDGLDAARTMRALPGQAGTPIVAVTANTFDEDRAACRAAGMNDFLAKPVDVPQLYRLLLHWLDATAPGTASAPLSAPAAGDGAPTSDGVDERMAPLLGLDGLDAAGGLASVGGRVTVYRRLLAVFAATHQGDGAQLQLLLSQGDPVSAGRLAHRLRGSAATLGLVDIEEAAGALERVLDGWEPEGARLPSASPAVLAQAVDDALAASLQRLRLALAA